VAIFKIENEKAKQLSLKKDGFGNEAKLESFFVKNLEELLGVRFLERQYPTPDGRIDTLGIDENNLPVIIEYKWKEDEDVLSQGLFYYDWLVKNKKHFDLLVKSKLGDKIKVLWGQPRIILIAQGFNRYIKAAASQIKNVELKTYELYEGDILHIEREYNSVSEKESAKEKVYSEDKTEYNLTYHLEKTSSELQKITNDLREKILQLPSVEEKLSQKTGITYRTTKSFTRLEFRKNCVQVLLRNPKYKEDTSGLVKDISLKGWGYLGMIKLTPEVDLSKVFELIEASYKSTL
jgi:predicted transport protein